MSSFLVQCENYEAEDSFASSRSAHRSTRRHVFTSREAIFLLLALIFAIREIFGLCFFHLLNFRRIKRWNNVWVWNLIACDFLWRLIIFSLLEINAKWLIIMSWEQKQMKNYSLHPRVSLLISENLSHIFSGRF